MNDVLILVDEQDKEIGTEEKLMHIEKGCYTERFLCLFMIAN